MIFQQFMNVDDVNKRRQISAILRKLESKFSAIYHNIKDKSEFKILHDKFEAETTFHGSCFNLLQAQGCPSPSSKL